MDKAPLDRFREIAEAHGGIDVKGKKMPYTAVNGNMFAFLSPEGELCLRFDEAARAGIAVRYGHGSVMRYGAVMRGYVALPLEEDLGDGDSYESLFAESLAFARGLKPKPTRG